MSRFLSQSLTIASKDLRSEFRSKEALNASVSFSIVILLLFSFAFDPGADEIRVLSGGLLWLVFAFASAIVLNRSFARELPNDCLDAIISSPVSGAALFAGKACANFLLLLVVEAVCLIVFGIFYDVRWTQQFWPLVGVTALATWALTAIGTMFSALTVNLRLRELMLPVLVYPMMIPPLLAAMQLTTPLVNGSPIEGDTWIWVRVLVAFDIIFTLLAASLIETVLEG